MKKLVFAFLILILGLGLNASVMDDSLDEAYRIGGVARLSGDNVWAPNGYFESEDAAYTFVAWNAMLFLYIHMGWDASESSSVNSEIKSLEAVCADWDNGYRIFNVSIPLWEICDEFGEIEYAQMESYSLYEKIKSYVDYYGDIDRY